MPTIALTESIATRHRQRLEALSSQGEEGPIRVQPLPVRELSAADFDGVDAVFVSVDYAQAGGNIRQLMEVVCDAPTVNWVHIGWAGSDSPMVQALLDRGTRITHSAGATAEPIALSAIGGMLVLHRGFNRWFRNQAEHAWKTLPRDQAPPDLRGQTMVVLGLGSIGTHVANFARGFGLNVIGVRRKEATLADGVDEWLPPDRLLSVMPRANWLAITVPLTEATRNMVTAEAIALMPAGAYVLNVSRGAIIDEQAMIEALQSGHLAGAYLDVFAREPLPPDSPLWDMPNVVISPHDSWPSQGNNARIESIFFDELKCWLTGATSGRVVTER